MMDNHMIKGFTRKGIEKIRESVRLFSSHFSVPGKIKHNW